MFYHFFFQAQLLYCVLELKVGLSYEKDKNINITINILIFINLKKLFTFISKKYINI